MKNFFLILFLFTGLSSFGQQTEGHIQFKVDFSSDKPEMQMQIGMLQGSTMEVYFKDKTARMEFAMGTMMKTVTITNSEKDEMLTLMSGMMGSKAIKGKISEQSKEQEEANSKIEVKLENETKTILGYTCKKAVMVDDEGNETVFWYSTELAMDTKGQNMMNSKIPGVPLEYEINNSGMKMKMTATKIDKKLDKKASELFDLKVPEGYEEISAEDLMKMGGQ